MTETTLQHPAVGRPDAEHSPLTGLADGLRGLAAVLAQLDSLAQNRLIARRRDEPALASADSAADSALDGTLSPDDPADATTNVTTTADDDFDSMPADSAVEAGALDDPAASTEAGTSSRAASASSSASSSPASAVARQQLEILREIARYAAEMKISLRRLENRESLALFALPAMES